MKLELKGGMIVAHAETKKESIALYEMANPTIVKTIDKVVKKYYPKISCSICGKKYKRGGISLHRNKMHGIKAEEVRNEIAIDHWVDEQV